MFGGCGVIGDPWLAEDCESLYGYMCRYTEGIKVNNLRSLDLYNLFIEILLWYRYQRYQRYHSFRVGVILLTGRFGLFLAILCSVPY